MGAVSSAARILSRRAFAGTLAGVALHHLLRNAKALAAAELDQSARLAWSVEKPGLSIERRYRADAQVLVFGLPVLRRESVGGGSAVWREFDAGAAVRLLEFSGFSTPARAAGLNRLGFLREMARKSPDGPECIYFGLMTTTPEESAEEARRALHSGAKEQAFSVIEGRVGGGQVETASAHFMAGAIAAGQPGAELIDQARRALASTPKVSTAGPAGETLQPFLQTLVELLTRRDGAEGRYIYAGRQYKIRLARSEDARATAHFRELRLIDGPAEVIRVSGRIRREPGGKETEFRLWIPDGAERPLPLRIEYQAKPYLRLFFEAVAD